MCRIPGRQLIDPDRAASRGSMQQLYGLIAAADKVVTF
jgi:hypothetical protein